MMSSGAVYRPDDAKHLFVVATMLVAKVASAAFKARRAIPALSAVSPIRASCRV